MKIKLFLFVLLVSTIIFNTQAQFDIKVKQTNLVQCDTAGWVIMRMRVINMSPVAFPGGSLITGTYKVDNTVPVVQNFNTISTMNPGDSMVLQFTNPFHFNQYATYNCMFAAHYASDANTANDTVHYTRTYHSLPGFGNHASDTAVCHGSPATLWMELLGQGPWLLTFAAGTDTALDLPINVPILSTDMTLDSTTTFTLIRLVDSNGCSINVNQGITITIGYPFTLNIGHDTTMCAGKTLLIDAGHTGATYNWWDNTGGQVYAADTSDWSGILGNQVVWVDVNDKGCIDRDSLTINWIICPDGIAENTNAMFDVFPNPTAGMLNISFENQTENGWLTIENDLGQLVFQKEILAGASAESIDLSLLQNGLYFVSLFSNHSVIRKKVLLER
ncbi:MAG: T9SS type A sorting domain-containing protein [Bacteroidota bacterium]